MRYNILLHFALMHFCTTYLSMNWQAICNYQRYMKWVLRGLEKFFLYLEHLFMSIQTIQH